jgi:hypothetical protein
MYGKENRTPTKQGILYELSLGKNNGPYLIKDIMQTNPKSISLLAGVNIMRSVSSMN